MATFALRFSDDLKERAQFFAKKLGLSLNAVIIVALDDYLSARTVKQSGPSGLNSANMNDLAHDKKKKVVARNAPCPCGSGKKYKKCCEIK